MQKPSQQSWRIGHTVFTPETRTRKQRKILNYYYYIFSESDWILKYNDDDICEEWVYIFSSIQEASCELLQVNGVYYPPILINICYPNYSKLMNLYLERCGVQNIQFLTFLNAENMISIDLKNNFIHSVKPLNKLKWKYLSFIYLCNNPIVVFQIHRAKIKEEMDTIKLDQRDDEWVIGENMNFILKLPFKNFSKAINIELDHEGARIKQDKVVKTIKRKLPKIQIRQVRISRQSYVNFFRQINIMNRKRRLMDEKKNKK